MTVFTGTSGTDNFVGAPGIDDRFDFAPADLAGSDTVQGGGGAGVDTLRLTAAGDVAVSQLAGVTGIERIEMFAGSSIAVSFGMLLTSPSITIAGSNGNDSVFGSAGTDASRMLIFEAGAGNDVFVGTRGGDVVSLTSTELTAQDFFNGARGDDTLKITGGAGLQSLALQNVFGFETIALKGAAGFDLVVLEATASSTANNLLTIQGSKGDDDVDATAVGQAGSRIVFNGGDGNDFLEGGIGRDKIVGGDGVDFFHGNGGKDQAFGGEGDDILHGLDDSDKLNGGDGNDTIYGGAGANRVTGGGGVDTLNVSGGSDTMIYAGPGESSTGSIDFLVGFDALNDRFDLDVTVDGVDGAASGTLNAATFDSDMDAATAASLGNGHAIVVTASGGNLSGRVFLVVDANGNGDYDGGADYVFELQAGLNLGSLGVGNFV